VLPALFRELIVEKHLHEQNLKLYRTGAKTNDADWAQMPLCVRYAELLQLRLAVLKIELEKSSQRLVQRDFHAQKLPPPDLPEVRQADALCDRQNRRTKVSVYQVRRRRPDAGPGLSSMGQERTATAENIMKAV
jgi:hypothetical protein